MIKAAISLAAVAALASGPIPTQGFAMDDLRKLSVDVSAFSGGIYAVTTTEPDQLTITCETCARPAAIEIALGRRTDGTEMRLRSGEITIADLHDHWCAPMRRCRVDPVSIAPAVGWVTLSSGSARRSVTVILLDGDMLTIRSTADKPDLAIRNAEVAFDLFARDIVGPE